MVKEAKVVHVVVTGEGVDVKLPQTIQVKNYAVGLVNLHGYVKVDWRNIESIPLCSNICEASVVGDTLKPILVSVTHSPFGSNRVKDINNIVWLKTSGDELSNVHLYLIPPKGITITAEDCQLLCTLVFIPLHK